MLGDLLTPSRMLKHVGIFAACVMACGGANAPANSATATSATASSSPTKTDAQTPPVTLGAEFVVTDFGLAGNAAAGDTCVARVVASKLARVECPWAITLEVATAMETTPRSKAAKDTATKAWSDTKSFKNETLPDGWQLTFDATDAGAPQYHAKMYRTIAGKAYECDITTKVAAERDKAIGVCRSLKAK